MLMSFLGEKMENNVERYEITGVIDQLFIVNIFCTKTDPDC